MYTFLDYFFLIFHGILVAFNLSGWAWHRVRRIHFTTISLTLMSWFGLGIFYGWGYCPCTDWHWQVKRRLGETHLPYSYIKYYTDKLTGTSWDPTLINAIVLTCGLSAFILSCWFNWKDIRDKVEGNTP